MLGSLKNDVSKTVGGAFNEDLNKLLDMFAANSESIEMNLKTLGQRIYDLEKNVIATIKKEKEVAIATIKKEKEVAIDSLNKEIINLSE